MRNPGSPGSSLVLIAFAGLATGVATLLGQGILAEDWNRLANSGAIWLLVAFLVGSVMPTTRWAIGAGIGVLVGAVVGYYASAAVIAGADAAPRSLAIWSGTALVGGPIYGLAGRLWRNREPARQGIALGLLGGIFVAEGIATVWRIPNLALTGWVEVVIGVGLAIVLGGSSRARAIGLAVVPLVVLAGVVAFEILGFLFTST